jgi:hypothetical protein
MPRTTDFDITDERLPWETTDHPWTDSSAATESNAISRAESPDGADPWATTPDTPVEELDEDDPRAEKQSLDRVFPDWETEPESRQPPNGDQARAGRLGRGRLLVAGSLALAIVVALAALTSGHRHAAHQPRRTVAAAPHGATRRAVVLGASTSPAGSPAPRSPHRSSRNPHSAKPRLRTQPAAARRPAPKTRTGTARPAASTPAPPVQTAAPPVAQPAQTAPSTAAAPAPSAPVTSVPARAAVHRSPPPSEFSFER